MTWMCRFAGSHDYEPEIVFQSKLEIENKITHVRTGKWDQEIWRGYVCSRCGKRELKQIYDSVSLPDINQKAFDWLHHKEKRAKLLKQLKGE